MRHWLLWLGLAAGACGDTGRTHAPIARVVVTPESVPLGDGWRTAVTLDGSSSADPLDDPGGMKPMLFYWTVDDPGFTPPPDLYQRMIAVAIGGSRPVPVHLTVQDSDGARTVADAVIAVLVP